MMLAANVHIGSKNADAAMSRYIYKRRGDGIYAPISVAILHHLLFFRLQLQFQFPSNYVFRI